MHRPRPPCHVKQFQSIPLCVIYRGVGRPYLPRDYRENPEFACSLPSSPPSVPLAKLAVSMKTVGRCVTMTIGKMPCRGINGCFAWRKGRLRRHHPRFLPRRLTLAASGNGMALPRIAVASTWRTRRMSSGRY